MVDFTRRKLLASSVTAAVGAGAVGTASADDGDTPGAPWIDGKMKRFSTTALGAEVTGPEITQDGELIFSNQHPSGDNQAPFDVAGVGYFSGHQFEFDGDNDDFEALEPPTTDAEVRRIRGAGSEYVYLAQNGDPINGGTEAWGQPQTPDGTPLSEFAGSRYGAFGTNPDMNHLIETDEDGTEGYLFTNNETSPGCLTRTPISRTEDGEWEADLENAMELANTDAFREIGGSRINCYGDHSPWNTPLSAEENYAHTRLSGTATASEIVEAGSGVGLRGASEFWYRPNPTEIGDAIDEIFGDDAWGLQGSWAMGGVEMLAYYLGADPVDQDGDENTIDPIGDVYPNVYDYGYIVDVWEPASDEPKPFKHYAWGRAAYECPGAMYDEQTVYLTSDGSSKGIYKFVAEEPMSSYEDPMDIRGTLYAIHVTNGALEGPPAERELEIEWLELGTASHGEVQSWIAEYDDLTQVDYLETHADTDWEEDLEAALAEADETVAIEGNQDLITDEEIVEWAEQYEEMGPDGVDEDLRRVPFLETRAAAKEIGASVEFRKAEGIDVRDGAGPGDFVYFGISEVNDGMTDDHGELQLDRVDAGMVYRGQLDADYDVTTLEPAVVGPDATDPANVADDAIINIDNVKVMRDGRVLLCEDADQLGRSFPNDSLWVYQPPVFVDVDSVAVARGKTGTIEVTASSLPSGLSGARVTVTLDHEDVAAISGVDYPEEVALAKTRNRSATELTFELGDLDDAVRAGATDVTLASIDVTGVGAGSTDVTVSAARFDDDEGESIEVSERAGMIVVGPPAIDGNQPPTDPDGDGRFEDLNGNGRMDFHDVRLLFEHVDEDAVRLNEAAYDFNDNGEVDYDDVVDLYQEL